MPENMPETRINVFNDSPARVQTPAQQAPQVEYASLMERFVALLIDYGLIMIPGQVILMLATRNMELEMAHIYALTGLLNAVFVLYMAVFSCGGRVPLGKKLVGIAVASADDPQAPIGFMRALLRSVGYYLSAGLLMCGFLMAFFEERKRALEDFMGRSVVVRLRPKGIMETVAITLTGLAIIAAYVGVFYSQTFAKGSAVQLAYIDRAQKTLEDLSLLQEIHRSQYGYFTNDLQRLVLLSGDPVQFQRDIQRTLDRRGFKLGVSRNTYKIIARAKDTRHTQVVFIPYRDR